MSPESMQDTLQQELRLIRKSVQSSEVVLNQQEATNL